MSRPHTLAAWGLLPVFLVVGLSVSACGATFTPPVITGEDQAQVRAAAVKVLAGIEVAGVIVRDSRQVVSDLATQGFVPISVRNTMNTEVIRANAIVQRVITELDTATRMITVTGLTQQVVGVMSELADLLERQADSRVQLAGRFLRSAISAVAALIGVA